MISTLRFFCCLAILLTHLSCQTQEQIVRQKQHSPSGEGQNADDSVLSNQEQQAANLVLKIQSFEQRLNQLQGLIEEIQFQLKSDLSVEEQRRTIIEKKLGEIEQVKNHAQEQKQYLDKVLNTLESLQKNIPEQKSTKKKLQDSLKEIGPAQKLEKATTFYKKKDFVQAKVVLEDLANNQIDKFPLSKKNRIFFYLATIFYQDKNWDQSLPLFSEIYLKSPKSSFAPEALLHIGKILHSQGQKKEALEALEKLQHQYPHTPFAKEAKNFQKESFSN
jgi:TolA-binding protein